MRDLQVVCVYRTFLSCAGKGFAVHRICGICPYAQNFTDSRVWKVYFYRSSNFLLPPHFLCVRYLHLGNAAARRWRHARNKQKIMSILTAPLSCAAARAIKDFDLVALHKRAQAWNALPFDANICCCTHKVIYTKKTFIFFRRSAAWQTVLI